MIIVEDLQQGSQEWLLARCGVFSASRAAEFSQPPKPAPFPSDAKIIKEGKINTLRYGDFYGEETSAARLKDMLRAHLPPVYTDARQSYLMELVGEACTGIPKQLGNFKQLEWGKEYEPEARALLELETGLTFDEVGFIYRDKSNRAGISPDGINQELKIGCELKCPFDPAVHAAFICNDKIKAEYIHQCQFSMWVTGYRKWYFASYHPQYMRKKLHYVVIERDEEYMKKYDTAFGVFINDFDKALAKVGIKFGEHWGN